MNKFKALLDKINPVKEGELAQFLYTSGLLVLITYIHSTLKIAKDSVVISELGTESISAIKMWAVLPIALIFMVFYIKLSDSLTRAKLFHSMNWFFASYFILFTVLLFPNREALTINISPDSILTTLPVIKYLVKIIQKWYCMLFYVFSESFVTIMLSISFWQTANHITSLEQSKRFYPIIGVVAQLGLILAGMFGNIFSTTESGGDFQGTLNLVTTSIVIASALMSLCLYKLERIVGVQNFNAKTNLSGTPAKGKTKMKLSLSDSFKFIMSSKPILLITTLLLCYNISINLVEGVWKKSVEMLYSGNATLVHHFMSNVSFCVGILTLVIAAVGVYLLRAFKWSVTALVTPVAILFTGAIFFLAMIAKDSTLMSAYVTSALSIGAYFGAMNVIFARATKHSLFDATKEMVYIPLDDELKTKGKAAAETIGMRFGKGSGAFIQQILLGIFPALTLADLSPIISGIFLALLISWIVATISLSKKM